MFDDHKSKAYQEKDRWNPGAMALETVTHRPRAEQGRTRQKSTFHPRIIQEREPSYGEQAKCRSGEHAVYRADGAGARANLIQPVRGNLAHALHYCTLLAINETSFISR